LINSLKDNKRKERVQPTQDMSRAFGGPVGGYNQTLEASPDTMMYTDMSRGYYQPTNRYAGMF
jgi:hypothetical protein